MKNLDPVFVKGEIERLRLSNPEIWEADDEQLLSDMLQGSTNLHEFLAVVVDRQQDAAGMIEAIRERRNAMTERQARYEARERAMRELAMNVMRSAGTNTVTLPDATLSVRQGVDKVEILDAASCPDELCRIKKEPDKSKIKQALEEGEQFNWAAIVKGQNTLGIRTK